jgi:transposase
MTEQQQHLSSATQQQKTLIAEMQTIEQTLNQKRDLTLKLQGIIEYLTGIGITLSEQESVETEEPAE